MVAIFNRFPDVLLLRRIVYLNLGMCVGVVMRRWVLFYLCDLTPAVTRVSHQLQTLFLGRRPGRIRPTFLSLGLLGDNLELGARRSCCVDGLGARRGHRACHLVLRLSKAHRLALSPVAWRWWLRRRCEGVLGGRGGRRDTGQLARWGKLGSLLWIRRDRRRFQAPFGGG